MTNDLDMNSYRILNLPDAVLPQEPATKAQLDAITGGDYAPLVHTHVVADITDYTSATNSLINAAVAAINASGVPDGDKGDITVTGSGLTWTLDTGVVSTSKMGGDVTTAGKALLDDANAAAQRTTLGLGTAATSATGDFAAASHSHAATDITSGLLNDARLNTTIPRYADSTANFSGDLQVGGVSVGYKNLPQNAQTGNYTLVLTDSGKHIFHASGDGAGDTYTIPANASVAFPLGTVVTFANRDSNSVSIAITTDTMYLGGTTTTGTRTLAQNGVATAIKVSSTVWIISGPGLT
jgi:hypothetical protein